MPDKSRKHSKPNIDDDSDLDAFTMPEDEFPETDTETPETDNDEDADSETDEDDFNEAAIADEGAFFGDDVELSDEELALSREFLRSDSGKHLIKSLKSAPLTYECKAAFARVITTQFSKDVMLAFITRPDVARRNVQFELAHVVLSASTHDVRQPEYLQINSLITTTIPFIHSRGRYGEERRLQGLHRSETKSGQAESYQTQIGEKKKKQTTSFWRR